MSLCRTCGKEWPEGTTSCPDDGTPVRTESEATVKLDDKDLMPVASTSTSRSSDLKPGEIVAGYVIDARIGQGGMGEVYGARQPRINKKVAIKVLARLFSGDATAVERFEQEARLVNEIQHPNIVDVFQFGELPDGRSFFVMEWLDGEGLGARLDRGPLPVKDAVEILDVICDALQAAHEKGVIHRDLKADNIFLVSERGQRKVKLLDFGLAKLSGRHGANGQAGIVRTESGILMGTPAYMSPEQARGKNVDHRTDIYALGILGYKMLTSQLPFSADNAMDVLVQHLSRPAPSPSAVVPDVPEALSRVIVRMMAKMPEDRPTLAEMRQVLSDIRHPRGHGPPPRRLTTSTPPIERPKKSGSGTGVFLTVLFLCLAGGAALWAWQTGRFGRSPKVAAGPPQSASRSPSTPRPAPAPATPSPPPRAVEPSPGPTPTAQTNPPVAAPVPASPPTATLPTPAVTGPRQGKRRDPQATTPAPAAPAAPAQPPDSQVGTLVVKVDVDDAQIDLDGKALSQSGGAGRFEVAPGLHVLTVSAPGRETVRRDVSVKAGRTITVSISTAPVEGEPSPPPENPP